MYKILSDEASPQIPSQSTLLQSLSGSNPSCIIHMGLRSHQTSEQVQCFLVFMHSSVFCQFSVGGLTQASDQILIDLYLIHKQPNGVAPKLCALINGQIQSKNISSTRCRRFSRNISVRRNPAWKNLPRFLHLHPSYRSIAILLIHFKFNPCNVIRKYF